MKKTILAVAAALLLSGCTVSTTYIIAHKEAIGAAALVGGLAQTWLGAFNQADEAGRRIEHRVEEAEKK